MKKFRGNTHYKKELCKLNELDVYLYGMTVLSTIHRLHDDYPKPDTYGEIAETYNIPGGETGNSAVILANFGLKVMIDGPYLGYRNRDAILEFYQSRGVDCSALQYDPEFEGLQDLVLIDKHSRTVFGKFGQYFGGGKKQWNHPNKEAIEKSRFIGIDPFFGEDSLHVAELAVSAGKQYVSIDAPPESYITQHAAAMAISNEFIQNTFPGEDVEALFRRYTSSTDGLIIFTFGAREILFGRKGSEIQRIIPYSVDVKSTLGAGDTFRAGVLYGVINGWNDEKIVRFAAATAACVCARFPMALNPPSVEEISNMASK